MLILAAAATATTPTEKSFGVKNPLANKPGGKKMTVNNNKWKIKREKKRRRTPKCVVACIMSSDGWMDGWMDWTDGRTCAPDNEIMKRRKAARMNEFRHVRMVVRIWHRPGRGDTQTHTHTKSTLRHTTHSRLTRSDDRSSWFVIRVNWWRLAPNVSVCVCVFSSSPFNCMLGEEFIK